MGEVISEEVPNPGSREALDAGCTCPVVDNNFGWGYWSKGTYAISMDCPLHRGLNEVDESEVDE